MCDSSERLIKSPIVTGNLFSDGKMPTTPAERKKVKNGGVVVDIRVLFLPSLLVLAGK